MLYISCVEFPLYHNWQSLSWRSLISSKDKEENLMAREKNPFSQLRRPRDRATFSISFVMESGMPKTFLPFDHDKEEALIPIVRSNFIPYKISYMHRLFIIIKGKEGFSHTWFHHERDAEDCTISRTPELREMILLSSHQILFFILRGEERPPRERLGHYGGEGTYPWYI